MEGLEPTLDMGVAGIEARFPVQSQSPGSGEPCAWFNVCGQHLEILSFL